MGMTAAKLDSTPLRIGKYRGKTPLEIAEADPDYLVWAYDTWTPKPCSKLLYDACASEDSDDVDDSDQRDFPDYRYGRDD